MGNTHHSPGAAPDTLPLPALSSRERIIIASCILLITALAWAYLFYLSHQMSAMAKEDAAMAAMGMVMDRPWGAGDFGLTLVMWSVMMVGMMAPSALPVLLLFAGTRAQPGVRARVPAFGLGYIVVWVGFSACATTAQWFLHERTLLSPAMATTSTTLAGVILIAAGIYQLTPFKAGCLSHCQSPLGFLMSHWRDGTGGAFRMGIGHGVFCLGCCWALMAVLFVVGVMNLAWVAVLTVFILIEKLAPAGARISWMGGAGLVVLGVRLTI